MTAASYDLLYLGIPTYIFLSGDGIDFSPIKISLTRIIYMILKT